MPITLDQIVEETRELPSETVAELVDRIMAARHGGLEPSIAAAWKAESDRRIEEIESGRVKGIPLEESLARARKIAGLWPTCFILKRTRNCPDYSPKSFCQKKELTEE
jgi:putative addiction module component (TIGR02574 family)